VLVKCVNATGTKSLTEGAIYEAQPYAHLYGIMDDDGYRVDFYQTRFVPVETEEKENEKSSLRE
jgi:hypothetical protein